VNQPQGAGRRTRVAQSRPARRSPARSAREPPPAPPVVPNHTLPRDAHHVRRRSERRAQPAPQRVMRIGASAALHVAERQPPTRGVTGRCWGPSHRPHGAPFIAHRVRTLQRGRSRSNSIQTGGALPRRRRLTTPLAGLPRGQPRPVAPREQRRGRSVASAGVDSAVDARPPAPHVRAAAAAAHAAADRAPACPRGCALQRLRPAHRTRPARRAPSRRILLPSCIIRGLGFTTFPRFTAGSWSS